MDQNEAQHIRSAQQGALENNPSLADERRRMNSSTQIGESGKKLAPIVGELRIYGDRKIMPRHNGKLDRNLADALARARRESRA